MNSITSGAGAQTAGADRAPRRLLVFAGSGSPFSESYAGGYQLLKGGAGESGFEEVEIVSWPGQKGGGETLRFDRALNRARQELHAFAKRGGSFALFARSFGTLVAAKLLGESDVPVPRRTVLWGPPPYPVMWSLFRRDFEATAKRLRGQGTEVDPGFFESIEPFEANFTAIRGDISVAFGTADKYCPPAYRAYLEHLASKTRVDVRFPDPITDAPHEVDKTCADDVKKAYLNLIFAAECD